LFDAFCTRQVAAMITALFCWFLYIIADPNSFELARHTSTFQSKIRVFVFTDKKKEEKKKLVDGTTQGPIFEVLTRFIFVRQVGVGLRYVC
jgi:hypothetical protein